MTEISQDRYDEEIQRRADALLEDAEYAVEEGEYGDVETAVYEISHHSLDGHGWFMREGPAFHGAILKHSHANIENRVDIHAHTERKSPEGIVETLAYLSFEADVIETALDQIE